MTAFADLTLTDSSAVAQTLKPVIIDSTGVAKWLGTESVLDGKKSATMSMSLPKNGSPVARLRQRITIPVMDTVDTNKKIGDAYVNVEYVLPKQASLAQRLDLRAYLVDLSGEAVTTAALTNFESIY